MFYTSQLLSAIFCRYRSKFTGLFVKLEVYLHVCSACIIWTITSFCQITDLDVAGIICFRHRRFLVPSEEETENFSEEEFMP